MNQPWAAFPMVRVLARTLKGLGFNPQPWLGRA